MALLPGFPNLFYFLRRKIAVHDRAWIPKINLDERMSHCIHGYLDLATGLADCFWDIFLVIPADSKYFMGGNPPLAVPTEPISTSHRIVS
jgi:hypothetical protein